jgi:hypothetical protein
MPTHGDAHTSTVVTAFAANPWVTQRLVGSITWESTRSAVRLRPSDTEEYRSIGDRNPWSDANVNVTNVTVGTPGPPENPEPVMVPPSSRWDSTKARRSVAARSRYILWRSHNGEQPAMDGGASKLVMDDLV